MPRTLPPAPEWGTDAGVALEPVAAQKEAGFPQGFQPPARWQNWWQRDAYAHLDQLHDQLLKDWRATKLPTSNFFELGFHDGFYYASDLTTFDLYRSLDGRHWNLVSNTGAGGSIESDGSRMIMVTGASFIRYSDDGGLNFFGAAGVGAGPGIAATYLPHAGLWVGSDSVNTLQSADGGTWVTNTAGGSAATSKLCENADGSIIFLGDGFSVDGGASWSPQTNVPVGLSYYFFSPLRGKFIAAKINGSTLEFYQDSGVAGDWEGAPYVTLPNMTRVDRFFELRGTLFVVARETATPGINDYMLLMSRDAGTTWERACSLHSFAFQGVPRTNDGIADTGYVALLGSDSAGDPAIYTPPFNGDQTPLVNP